MIDFLQPPSIVARTLIGAMLTVEGVGGRIVETEAYDLDDEASHSFAGQTARNAVMFGPPARAYVYRSYGLHWCLNIVCGPRPGGAVLLRALEPLTGIDAMIERRGMSDMRRLAAGPGRLCQALGVDGAHNGVPIGEAPFELLPSRAGGEILVGPRIGISKARDRPWRFGLAGSGFFSRPFAVRAPPPVGEPPRD